MSLNVEINKINLLKDRVNPFFDTMPNKSISLINLTLKSILKEKHVPQGGNGKTYNLKEYVEAMNNLANAMAKILVPPHHRLKWLEKNTKSVKKKI